MRHWGLRPVFLLCLFFGAAPAPPAGTEKDAELASLLRMLQDGRSSNQAASELRQRARADPEIRKYLATHLPALLAKYQASAGRENLVWENEAKLAGELRISEAVPALCNRIDLITNPGGGGSFGYNFIDRAAVWSLILIGAPAVPTVAEVLKHGNPTQRQEAGYILGAIGGSGARRALSRALTEEKDPRVRGRIEEALAARR